MSLVASEELDDAQESRKKIRRYARLLVAQIVFIIFTHVLFHVFQQNPTQKNFLIYTFSFGVVGTAATWVMYSMIKNFSTNKKLIRLVFAMFFVSFTAGMVATNPLDPIPFDSSIYFFLAMVNQLGSLLSFSIILILMIRDIFTETHAINYKLLGAACIYFNIGIVFSFVYTITNLLVPNSMGLNMPAEFISYMHCVNYSFFVLSGLDTPYEVNGIIRSIAVIQSLFANLYIVLVIGRLLIK